LINTRIQAIKIQQYATNWLFNNLVLKINHKNNVIIKASHGLRFLGHNIYPYSDISIDRAMIEKLKRNITIRNTASYKSMYLPDREIKQIDWLVLRAIRSTKNV
jgi:hypothetical protein